MHVGVVADKTESLYGLQLEDLLTHLLSLSGVVVSVQERFRNSLDFNVHARLRFIPDFSGFPCDSYVLYGVGAFDIIKGVSGDICYIPDPDFTSPFQELHEELGILKEHYKTRYPRGSYFSLFAEDLDDPFNYLRTRLPQDDIRPFDLCMVVDDGYEKLFEEFDFHNTNVLIIYIGSDNKTCEDAVEGMWAFNPNVSLSTFQEPVSFSHACLAKKILFACKLVDHVSICKMLRDVRFCVSEIQTTNIALAALPIFTMA